MISSQNTLLKIQFGVIISYGLIKFLARPFVLEQNYGGIPEIFVLSYPNFCEAIVGTIPLTFLLLVGNNKINNNQRIKERNIPLLATIIAGFYVILQEFKIHNLGGKNIYDPYDVAFSAAGLLLVYFLLNYIQPRFIDRRRS